MRNHSEIAAHLAIYNDLDVEIKAAVDAHLHECASCAATLRSYQEMDQSIKLLMVNRTLSAEQRRIELPRALAAKQRVHQSPVSMEILWFHITRWLHQWQPVMVGAAALALLVLFFYTYLNYLHQQLPNLPETVQTPVSPEEEAARDGIEATLARELIARHSIEPDQSFVDPETSASWRSAATAILVQDETQWQSVPLTITVTNLEMLRTDLALVSLEIEYPLYKMDTGRVYRLRNGQWLWTEVPAALWGEHHMYETAHLRFEYQERNAAEIPAIADRLENLYQIWMRDFAVNPTSEQRLTLSIIPEDIIADDTSDSGWRISSPELRTLLGDNAPVTERYTAFLAAYVLSNLVGNLQQESSFSTTRWRILQPSLMELLLQKEFPHASFLYQTRNVWWRANTLAAAYPLTLDDMLVLQTNDDRQLFLAVSLVNYVNDTYGQVKTIDLLRQVLRKPDQPSVVIAKVFNTTLPEFESSWNNWLLSEDPAVRTVVAARTEIVAALQSETEAIAQADAQLYEQILDADADDTWLRTQRRLFSNLIESDNDDSQTNAVPVDEGTVRQYALVNLFVHGEFARVQVRVVQPGNVLDGLIEGRMYKRVGDRWYRTEPQAFAQPKRMLFETNHFRLFHSTADTAIVIQAAPQLELAYARLLALLQLSEIRPVKHFQYYLQDNKFSIEITDEEVNSWSGNTTAIPVTTPAFHIWPQEMSESNVLVYNIMTRIYGPLMTEVNNSTPSQKWGMLTSGYGQWLLDESLPASPWYGTAYAQNELERVLRQYYPLQISELIASADAVDSFPINRLLLDYVVATYGEQSVAPYIRALGEYEDWDTLAQAVFGVDGAAFEDNWNQYLAEEYPELTSK